MWWYAGTGKPALFFEGGQTPFWKRLPKRGEHNPFSYTYDNVLLAELDAYIRAGKLDPRNVITMKHMYDAGLLEKKAYNRNGVSLLAKQPSARKQAKLESLMGHAMPETFQVPCEIEVRIANPHMCCVKPVAMPVTSCMTLQKSAPVEFPQLLHLRDAELQSACAGSVCDRARARRN